MKDKKKRSLPLTIVKVLLGVLAGLLLLCVLIAGGGLIWLRTPSAANFIARVVTEQLSSQGLGLQLGQISASLPQRLELKNIVLSDPDGIFFTASGLTLRTRLGALLSGRVEIEEISLDTPEAFRLPNLPASEEEPEAASSFSLGVLPFAIYIDQIAIRGGIAHTALIRLQVPPAAASPAEGVVSPAPPAQGSAVPALSAASQASPPSETAEGLPTIPKQNTTPSEPPQLVSEQKGPSPVPAVREGGQQAPPYALELSGSASLNGSTLAASLVVTLLNGKNEGLRLELTLDGASGIVGLQTAAAEGLAAPGEDSLRILLTLQEGADGLLSLLTGDPQFPHYTLELRGDGPVRDWQGLLSLQAGLTESSFPPDKKVVAAPRSEALPQTVPNKDLASLIGLKGTLGLQCRNGSLWQDLILDQDFGFSMQTTVSPGSDLSASLRNILGQSVFVDAKVAARQSAYHIDLVTSSKAWQISVSDAFIRSSEIAALPETPSDASQKPWPTEWEDASGKVHGSGLAVDGKIAASITDIQGLLAAGSETVPPSLPLKSVSLTSSLSALLDSGFTGARARGYITVGEVNLPQIAGADATSGDGTNTSAAEDYTLSYSIQADVTDRRARIQELLLDGLGISLQLAGNADTIDGAMAVDTKLHAADRSDWQTLLAQLGGFAKSSLGGSLNLALNLNLPGIIVKEGENPPASGKLTLEGADMRWPSAQLANILGRNIHVEASLAGSPPEENSKDGSDPGRYHLVLDTFSAGIINAKGTADFIPGRDPENDSRISLETGILTAVIEAAISDIAPFASDGSTGQASPVSGPLQASIGAKGPLKNLGLTVAVSSPDVAVQGTHLKNISVKADATSSFTNDAIAGRGAVSASIGQSPGGPVSLSGRWQASMPKNAHPGATQMRAALEGLLLRGAGLELAADLSLTLPLAVSGTVKTEIRDWKTIAALAGAPLSGGTASLNLRLAHGSRGQEANMDVRLASLRMQESGNPPSFLIRDVEASLSASRLLDNPDLDLTLRTGRGLAGPMRWGSGNGAVKGNSGNGEFSLALLNQGNRGRSGSNNTSRRSGKNASGAEALALQGRYALSKPEITLATLTMDNPRSKTGLRLQKPLVINLQQGVHVADLDLAFKPDGRLTADAAFAPGRLEVKAKLKKLPYSFFKLFTEANLPDGQLQANVDFKTGSSGPQGNFTVQSRISATQDVSGVVAQSSAAAGSVFEILLDGNLAAAPGSSAVEGSGVRRLPGIIWLQGTGTLGNVGTQAQARQGNLDFQLPLRPGANGIPLPDSLAPMAAKLYWKGEIAPLWQAIPIADRHLTGQTLIDLNVSGSMKLPKLLVAAYMANGRFEDIPNGLLISGITLEARNTAQGDVRALVSAKDDQSGNLAAEANLTGVSGQGNAKPQLALRGQLDKFSPLHRDDLNIALSGIFGLNGPLDALKITSQIVVNQGELNIAGDLGSSVPTLDVVNKKRTDSQEAPVDEEELVAAGSGSVPTLDMHILVPRYFYIRGRGLDSEWKGDLRINGTTASPSLRGSLKPVRGYLDLLSKTFTITEGEIIFTGGMNLNPALNVLLTYEGANITAFAKANGSAKDPKFTLESRPPLPQDEVLAMVLFGKRTSDLSRFEAIQLANSLRELSGFGGSGLDVLTGIRKNVGLDMLRIGGSDGQEQRTTSGQAGESNLGAPKGNGSSDAAGTPTLEAGKYINDTIYVGVEQGTTPESTAVRVEIELYPSISLEGKSTSESSEVGIGWKKDY